MPGTQDPDEPQKSGPAAGGFSGAGPCCYLIDRGEALPVPVAPLPPVTVAQRVARFQAEFLGQRLIETSRAYLVRALEKT